MGNQISLCSSSKERPSRFSVNLIDSKANETLKRKLKENWEEKTYQDIRSDPNLNGFTSEYLFKSANYKEFSSSADLSTLVNLAKMDLKKGTTIPELVFSCCQWFPNKQAIKSLIEVGKQYEDEKKVVESVFEYQHREGFNSMIIMFQMASQNRHENNDKYPSGPMLRDIEDSCLYMIELAKSSNLDLERILNHTTKTGRTLFDRASTYSERITKRLLQEPVRVNSITDKFVTPFFRVRFKFCFLKAIFP